MSLQQGVNFAALWRQWRTAHQGLRRNICCLIATFAQKNSLDCFDMEAATSERKFKGHAVDALSRGTVILTSTRASTSETLAVYMNFQLPPSASRT